MIFTEEAPEYFTGNELIDIIQMLPNKDGIEMIEADDCFELAGGDTTLGYTYIADNGDGVSIYAHIEVDDEGCATNVRMSSD